MLFKIVKFWQYYLLNQQTHCRTFKMTTLFFKKCIKLYFHPVNNITKNKKLEKFNLKNK